LKALTDSTYVLASLSLFPNGRTLSQKDVAHVSRIDIQAKARKTTETFIIESVCDLAPPPMEVQMNGLYILLSKMNKVMAMTMFEDLEEALALLTKMETEGTLRNTLMFTFGKWYLFPIVNLLFLSHFRCFAP
jgi:hypothetical protein